MHEELARTDALGPALEERLAWLETLSTMLAEARVVLPAADGCGEWRGLAHRVYGEALTGVRSQLSRAETDTREAIRKTRHAVLTLGLYG
ncbi:MAG: hypothetical protein JWM49_715 [Microbacteriaceae bacterium]|jgi:hypothetical protein|nr:hypothetical protein [Microbacteriaceae bacterium]